MTCRYVRFPQYAQAKQLRAGANVGLICHVLANDNGLVELSCQDVNAPALVADDWSQRIELMSAIDFSQGFLLPAPNSANIVRVPLMGRGIVWDQVRENPQ